MTTKPNKWEKRADKLREKFGDAINKLADERMQLLVEEWKRDYPHHALHIIFGMGHDSIRVDGTIAYYVRLTGIHNGRDYKPALQSKDGNGHRRDACIDILEDAMQDVKDITGYYRDGCPNDVDVKASPRKVRR